MSEEILVPCAQCGADIGVILGTGSRDDLAGLRCWRCDAGLPPIPPPAPPPPPLPHYCPLTSLCLYRAGWRCGDCGREFETGELALAALTERGHTPAITDQVIPC